MSTAPSAIADGFILLTPGSPRPSDSLEAELSPFAGEGSGCVAWRLGQRAGNVIRLQGDSLPAPICTPVQPVVVIGQLGEGRYTIVANLDGKVFGEARIDVLPSVEAPERTLDIALSKPSPRAGEPFAVTLSATVGLCSGIDFSAPPEVDDDRIVLDGSIEGCPFEPLPGLRVAGFRHAVPGLTAGNKIVDVRNHGVTVATFGFHVDADTSELPAAGGRFRITLRWTDRGGVTHDATAVPLTEESGQFWFFDPPNPEVTVKVVDGTAVNSAYWVFLSSMTDLGFTATVFDRSCAPGACNRERVYTQSAGHNRNFVDTSAFEDCQNCSP